MKYKKIVWRTHHFCKIICNIWRNKFHLSKKAFLIYGKHKCLVNKILHLLFVNFCIFSHLTASKFQVGWRVTGKWIAGNVACKVFLFLRAFGPYLSSNVLVCVSLDRYFAVLHPLKVNDARRRGKIMLAFAWGTSFVYCIPQVSNSF